MEVYVFMKNFSSGLQEKFGLEVFINGKQYLLRKEDGFFYKYSLNKTGTDYLKTKTSAKNDIVEKIVKNRINQINSPLTFSMSKNVEAFEKLKHMFV